MLLLRIASGRWGTVTALCNDRGECLALDFLEALDKSLDKHVDAMWRLLQERVPDHGPPSNEQQSKKLTDNILEFKRDQLRVLYFLDEGALVVCTHGFFKKKQKTPRKEIDRAENLRAEYFLAKNHNKLRFQNFQEADDEF